MPSSRFLFRLALCVATGPLAHAQLHSEIVRIAAQARGRVGVACALPGRFLDCNLNAAEALPMQSVYKLPIAMTTLHAVQEGHLELSQKLRFVPSAMAARDEYSPLRDAHPRGAVEVTVEQLLRRAVSESDNVACDVLLRAVGGPAAADAYVRSLGIEGIHIRDNEKTVDGDERLQYRNSAEPRALVALLRRLVDRAPLSAEHTRMLLGWMANSHSGDERLRAQLPPGTLVADKTGTAGQGRSTMNATNDAGLITLPDGERLAVAVQVADAQAPFRVRQRVIAEIGHAVWEAALRGQ